MLSGTYFCHNSIKIENKAVFKKMTKKEEPLNLNLEESSEVRSLAFPVSLGYWEFWKLVVDICSTNTRAFIIFRKVDGIVNAKTNSLKNTFEYDRYWWYGKAAKIDKYMSK